MLLRYSPEPPLICGAVDCAMIAARRRPQQEIDSMATGRTLGRDDLIASHYTISGADVMTPSRHSFAERVGAAAAAGFAGIGWTPEDYGACRAAGLSDADLRAILDDHGIKAAELEFVSGWAHGGDLGKAARRTEDRMYAIAEVFGPRHINVGELGRSPRWNHWKPRRNASRHCATAPPRTACWWQSSSCRGREYPIQNGLGHLPDGGAAQWRSAGGFVALLPQRHGCGHTPRGAGRANRRDSVR
jgi:hypothetical protein